MRKITTLPVLAFLVCFSSLLLPQNIQGQVSGVKTIPGDYNSITDAISQIRIAGVSGPTFLELQPGYNSAVETYPITIRAIPGVSSVNSVTISPAAAATGLSIVTASSLPVINFIGAYNIIIDGRPGRAGTARELTILNNGIESNAVSFTDGAIDNVVRYCVLESSPLTLLNAVVYFGRSGEPLPVNILFENSGNELSHCAVRTINSSIAIYSNGGQDVYNTGNKIINNEIMDFRRHGIAMFNFNSNWLITGNSFYSQGLVSTSDISIIHFGGAIPGSVNNTISGNFIGGQSLHAAGTKFNAEYVHGILLVDGSFIVENNIIQNFNMGPGSNGWSIFNGISVVGNASAIISGNQIGGPVLQPGSITVTGNEINCIGISNGSCGFVSITNNRINNFTLLAEAKSIFFGIASIGASNTVITGNEIDFVDDVSTGQISFTAISVKQNPNCPVSPQPAVLDLNLIKNITLSSDDEDVSFTGVEITGTGTESLLLHNNQVYKISISSPNAAASFAGISINDRISGNTGNIIGSGTEANSIMITGKTVNATAILLTESPDASISDDIIGNITVNGTLSAILKGINIQGGGKSNVTGNQLKDISISGSGISDMQGIIFSGAVRSSERSALHNNQVYKINVSSSDGEANFSGIKINDRIAGNTGNIIGSPAEANSILVTGKSASANGIRLNNSPDVSISDDIIANITANGTLDPGSVNGILFEGGSLAKIDSNDIHHLIAPVARGIFIHPLYGSSAVTLDKNNLAGVSTTTGKGIETLVTSEAFLSFTATSNTVNNWQTGVLLATAIGGTLQLSFQNNFVVDNQTGFVNNNTTAVNATCNWWGDASGPGGAGPGTGNPVGPNVIFSPWATISTYVAVNAGPDQTIYAGSGKTLTPTYTVCGTAAYLWSTGATTPSITVSPTVTTVYTIKITDANGHAATDQVTVFVQDPNLPRISILSTAVIEGNSGTNNAVFLLLLNKKSPVPVTVQYQTFDGTATAPQDYVQKSGTVTFPANSLVGLIQPITIQVKGDPLPEMDETFEVRLSNAINATINTGSATCTIIDNDPPCLRVNDTTATENTQQAVVRVNLSTPSSRVVAVKYDTKDGTAKAPADYTKVSDELLTFQPGETTKYITIVIKQDALNEPTERFQVVLKQPENASIATTSYCTAKKDGTVSILNSAPQQNRQILTKAQLTETEETLAIIVPGVLPRQNQLTIRGLNGVNNELVIFDSKGMVVAKLPHYKNSWSPGNLTTGIYFYQLRIRTKEDKYEIYRGKIFITD